MTLRVCVRTLSFWLTALLLGVTPVAGQAEGLSPVGIADPAQPAAYRISDIQGSQGTDGFQLRVRGTAPPTYTMYELFEPMRLVVDIAGGSFADSVILPMTFQAGPIAEIRGTVLADQQPPIGRLEIVLAMEQDYGVERQANDIVVSFKDTPIDSMDVAPDQAAVEEANADAAIMESPGKKHGSDGSTAAEPEEGDTQATVFPGYNRQAITVDFYKIDLHNVFRLFGEISGMNIVVDEGVAGSLTLSLHDVPWDFVLDLIINMKDLQKEERFNTLVVSPKAKEFSWPKRSMQKVAVSDEGSAGESFAALTIKQEQQMSAEQVEAGKRLAQGRHFEQDGQYDQAMAQYEEAFELWPDNSDLAMRLASFSLMRQGMNAKAVHYAKIALQLEPANQDAALFAAIALANMQRPEIAKDYFDMAVSGDKPSSEALSSYASFSEEHKMLVAALLLLARHEELYGDTMETMVARARIYDKEGNGDKAVAEYRALLLSGFALPPDLSRYIQGRTSMAR